MDNGLAALNEKYEEIEQMLSIRAASALGEATLKIFIDLLDEYHRELLKALDLYDTQREGTKEENTMLLGLVGANDTEFRAKLISQGEEIRFLRQQALDLNKHDGELAKKNDALTLEAERLKNELDKSFKSREADQKDFTRRMEDVTSKLQLYDALIKGKEIEIGLKGKELDSKLGSLSEEVKDRSSESIKKAVFRLNNMLIEIKELSGELNNQITAAKSVEQESKKGKSESGSVFGSIVPTADMLNGKVEEAVTILGKYMEVLTPPQINPSKVNWKKLFDDLKTRFSPQAASKKIKINVPKEKMPAGFINDPNLLLRVLSVLLQNSIEALPVEGAVDISITFSRHGAEAEVFDNGKSINEDQRDLLFMPLYTTKASHYGMGLADCRRILKALGGNIVYDASKGGNCFKVSIVPMRVIEQQTGGPNAH